MKVATASSHAAAGRDAIVSCLAEIRRDLGGEPTWIAVHHSALYSAKEIRQAVVDATPEDCGVHLATSCAGVMTQQGFCSTDGRGIGVFALRDAAGSYGCAHESFAESTPSAAAAAALEDALRSADRVSESPDLIWLTCTPGAEEQVLAAIQSRVGEHVPIVGGSAADNDIAGGWSLGSRTGIATAGVTVSVHFPSVESAFAFHSGYDPTTTTARVTRAEGRTLYELDGQPAALVYNDWLEGALDEFAGGGSVLAATTLAPLGRVAGEVGGVPFYKLSHPESFSADGAIHLFSDIAEGDVVTLMSGSPDSLVSRAGRVVRAAARRGDFEEDGLEGALVVYCAGCMLTVQERMDDVVASIRDQIGEVPFLGCFTFGEQGCFPEGRSEHGNLMISSMVFGHG